MKNVRLVIAATATACSLLTAGAGRVEAQSLPGHTGPMNSSVHSGTSAQKAKTVVQAALPETGKGRLANPFPLQDQKLPTPTSDQKMSLSASHLGGQITKAQNDVADRLAGLDVGSGELDKPSVNLTELEEDMQTERKLRRTQQMQALATASMKLWETTYDGKRERMVEVPEGEVPQEVSNTSGSSSVKRGRSAAPYADDTAKASPSAKDSPTKTKETSEASYPVVSSIYGMGDSLTAVVLVPYVGVVHAHVGDRLPDKRKLTVKSIGEQVTVVDTTGNVFPLASGSTVPAEPEGDTSKRRK